MIQYFWCNIVQDKLKCLIGKNKTTKKTVHVSFFSDILDVFWEYMLIKFIVPVFLWVVWGKFMNPAVF